LGFGPWDLGVGVSDVVLYHSRMSRKALLSLYLLALIARLAWVIVFRDLGLGLDDMFQYDMLGRSLAAGHGFRWYSPPDLGRMAAMLGLDPAALNVPPEGIETTFRAPLYPAFLAVVYFFSGLEQRLLAARLAQAALTATLAPLTALLARRLDLSVKAALIAGLILALYPLLTLYPIALVTENLFFPLTLIGMLLLLRAAENGHWQDYLWAGLAFGLAVLTRSIVVAFLPFAGLWLWKRGVNGLRGTIIICVVVASLTLPWAIRNSRLAGKPTFIETSLGYQLFIGYYPGHEGDFKASAAMIPLRIINDVERDRWAMEQALTFIRADPSQIPSLMLNKWRYFWGLEKRALIYFYSNGFFGYLPPIALIPAFLFFILPLVLVVTLAMPGLVFAPEAALDKRGLLLLFAGAYILPHLLIVAEDRYHLALLPYLAAYAGQAWEMRREIFIRLRNERGRLFLTLALLCIFFLGWGIELARDWPTLNALAGPNGWQLGLDY
jgi:4-amino-4-deoxy-L-arabinose transferase-like glycosyltransferase